jgi:hypothetical protein
MQAVPMLAQAQPFIKLVHANMSLITSFAASPEVNAQARANTSLLYQQANESTMKLFQSGAFAQMMQGLLKNYTEFVVELGQGGMALLSQGQAAFISQVANASEEIVGQSDGGRRTSR